MPIIIRGLGPERFSLLTLVWAALNYFTLFDLGFGRGTTKFLAEFLAQTTVLTEPPDRQIHVRAQIAKLYWSSMMALGALSLAGSLGVGLIAPALVSHLNDVPSAFLPEVHSSILILILAIPVMTLTANARGVMEAQQKFLAINILQLIIGFGNYLLPLLLLGTSTPLLNIVVALTGLRLLSLGAHIYLNFYSLPELRTRPRIDRQVISKLWHFGGWLTVSNVVGPVLVYFDRFVLGLLLPIRTVGFYTTPVEIVSKLWLIPSSLVRVLFPEFARDLQGNAANAKHLYHRSVWQLTLVMSPPCLILIFAAELILRLWLGQDFADQAAMPLKILTAGVFLNSVAWIPHTLLQSLGRTKLIAIIHSSEIPIYALLFWYLVTSYGIIGAALAWSARCAIDCLAMFFFANRAIGRFRSPSAIPTTG